MRCYLMRKGHIEAVEFLQARDDKGRIEEARELFKARAERLLAEGFEVWDGGRFIYRFPELPPKS